MLPLVAFFAQFLGTYIEVEENSEVVTETAEEICA